MGHAGGGGKGSSRLTDRVPSRRLGPRNSTGGIMRKDFIRLVGGVGAVLWATSLAAEAPTSVPGCAQVGAVLSEAELREIVPGHIHESLTEDQGQYVEVFSRLASPAAVGVLAYRSTDQPEDTMSGYRIEEEGICIFEPTDASWFCQKIALCASGEVDHVGFVEDGASWIYSAISPDPEAEVAVFSEEEAMRPYMVSPRPVYDTAHVAPAADWAVAEGDAFRGFSGLVGVYVAEGAGAGPVIRDFVLARDYSTGQRINDGRRAVGTLLRIEGQGLDVPPLFHWAGESGTWELMFGPSGSEGDRLDLQSATPGVVDIVTSAEGLAGWEHWNNLIVHLFSTYARWDPATHASTALVRVISPWDDLLARSVLVCDARELGAPQMTLLGGDTCRRYDRAFEVTEMLRGRNALQVAAAIGAQEQPLVMQVGDIAVAGDTITIGAAPVPPFVLIDTGQFQGWADWIDRTQGSGGRERPVTCRFPFSAAERLGDLEAGDLLRFRAELAGASDAGVQLDCRLG